MDQLDDLDAIWIPGQTEPEILNDHSIISSLDESLCFFDLPGGIYFVTMLRKVFAHGKTDRFFIVDHQ